MNLTFWVCNETQKPRHFLLVSAFTDSSMELRSFEKCQAPNEKELELLAEVS